jgi:hypothetical protein
MYPSGEFIISDQDEVSAYIANRNLEQIEDYIRRPFFSGPFHADRELTGDVLDRWCFDLTSDIRDRGNRYISRRVQARGSSDPVHLASS